LPEREFVELSVYNLAGQKIRTLLEGYCPSGLNQLTWDAKTDLGEQVPSGLYIYILELKNLKLLTK
jgi:flagellar hook assembly protein FlgD